MEHFYVGISRVRQKDHLRVIPGIKGDDSFNHLLKLKFEKFTRAWLAGMTSNGEWNGLLAKKYYDKCTK